MGDAFVANGELRVHAVLRSFLHQKLLANVECYRSQALLSRGLPFLIKSRVQVSCRSIKSEVTVTVSQHLIQTFGLQTFLSFLSAPIDENR